MSVGITAGPEIPLPEVELIYDDGEPLESDWHRLEMNLLIEVVAYRLLDRLDYYVGGNMFIYFDEEQARNRNFRGPDFFFVNGGVQLNPSRLYWAVWKEGGRYPDLIIELTSASTMAEDFGVKKDVYEQAFRTHEYFIHDPATNALHGWRLVGRKYQPITPNEHGWLWSEELGLWLGLWQGKFQGKPNTYSRFYDADGRLVPTPAEDADAQRLRAEAQRQRAETERQRAEAAEAEAARLRSLLAKPDTANGE